MFVGLVASFTAPTRLTPRSARSFAAPRCCATDVEAIVHACLEGPTSALPSVAKRRVEAYVRELLRYNERTNVYSKSAYQHLPFHVQVRHALGLTDSTHHPTDTNLTYLHTHCRRDGLPVMSHASPVHLASQHHPFRMNLQDSVVLAEHLASQQPMCSGVLDLGSGSGLPSVVLACVMPEVPVYAVESKSRKTRFLAQVRLHLREYRATSCATCSPFSIGLHPFTMPTTPPYLAQLARKLDLPLYTPLTQNVKARG